MVTKEKQLSFEDLNFPTQYHALGRQISNPGNPVHTLYTAHFDETGHYELVEDGKVNVYDEIQSHADSVDIHILLKRYAEGDATALARVQGQYLDVTGMPKTYAELFNVLNDAENVFLQLPLEERAKYDHSFEVWLSSLDFNAPSSAPDSGSTGTPDKPSEPAAPSPESKQE